jgi:hypothetical protein
MALLFYYYRIVTVVQVDEVSMQKCSLGFIKSRLVLMLFLSVLAISRETIDRSFRNKK